MNEQKRAAIATEVRIGSGRSYGEYERIVKSNLKELSQSFLNGVLHMVREGDVEIIFTTEDGVENIVYSDQGIRDGVFNSIKSNGKKFVKVVK